MGLGAYRIEGADLNDNALALVTSRQVTSKARGRLYYAVVYNTGNTDAWLQFYDLDATGVAALTNASIPNAQIKVLADSHGYLDFGAGGRPIVNGIYLAGSTNNAGYTLTGAVWIIDTGYRNL